jgi:restriction endonuclease
VTVALTQENVLQHTIINFSARKHSPINSENNLSEGFHSIWQPPKIS